MFLNPWYSNVGRGGDDSAVPTSSPSASDSGSYCPSPPADQPVPQWCGHQTACAPDDTHGDEPAPGELPTSISTGDNTSSQLAPGPASLHLPAHPTRLDPVWTAHCDTHGRYFFCNEQTRCSSWLPPLSSWSSCRRLPYGWEMALDSTNTAYFINHVNRTTTYMDPRREEEPAPQPRHVTLSRDPQQGFGFVAGSEKPVIVRFITDGGPSEHRLMAGDQLLAINGLDVKTMARDQVIDMVHSSQHQMELLVCQPPLDNSARKSALLSAAKKTRLRSSTARRNHVRFADGIIINGRSSLSPFSSDDFHAPFLPNVLKVFLENGQTKSFKYSWSTTVQEVLDSLSVKLGISSRRHFGIALQQMAGQTARRARLTLLDGAATVAKIASRPGAHNLRCILRLAFVPSDAYQLLKSDPVAFEYLYVQCCADVVQERFAPELKHDVALLLAALHIHQHVASSNDPCKLTVKNIEREYGLQRFVPGSLLASMKPKELRKLLAHFLKSHQIVAGGGGGGGGAGGGGGGGGGQRRHVTALQYKLHYVKIIAELPSYGAKCYSAAIDDECKPDSVVLISPRFGVSRLNAYDNEMPERVCDIDQITGVEIDGESEDQSGSERVTVLLRYGYDKSVCVSLEAASAAELVLVASGYYQLLTGRPLAIKRDETKSGQDTAPAYHSTHRVSTDLWSYSQAAEAESATPCVTADFSLPPPVFRQREPLSAAVDRVQRDRHVYNGGATNGTRGKNSAGSSPCHRGSPVPVNSPAKTGSINQTYNHQLVNSVTISRPSTEQSGQDNSSLASDICESPTPSLVHCSTRIISIEGGTSAVHEMSSLDGGDGDSDSLRSVASRSQCADDTSRGRQSPQADGLLRLAKISKDRLDGVDVIRQSIVQSEASPPLDTATGQQGGPLTREDSSFGLHTVNSCTAAAVSEIASKGSSSGPDTVNQPLKNYCDSDLIDLTKIPPPATPDQEMAGDPSLLTGTALSPSRAKTSSPPTLFSDQAGPQNGEQSAAPPDAGDHVTDTGGGAETMCVSPACDSVTSSGFDSQPDIDSIIANLTLPPPPPLLPQSQMERASHRAQVDSPVVELTRDDIASFIIPPPPGSQRRTNTSPGARCDEECSLDPIACTDEVHVPVVRCTKQRVCSRIATLQNTLLQSTRASPATTPAPTAAPTHTPTPALNPALNPATSQRVAVYVSDHHSKVVADRSELVAGSMRNKRASSERCVSDTSVRPPQTSAVHGHSRHASTCDSDRVLVTAPPLPPKRVMSTPAVLPVTAAEQLPPLPPKLTSPQSSPAVTAPPYPASRCNGASGDVHQYHSASTNTLPLSPHLSRRKQHPPPPPPPPAPPHSSPSCVVSPPGATVRPDSDSDSGLLTRLQTVCRRLKEPVIAPDVVATAHSSTHARPSHHLQQQQLAAACRQLVTASKQLVQAAADGVDMRPQLRLCVQLAETAAEAVPVSVTVGQRAGEHTEPLAEYLHATCVELLATGSCATAAPLDVALLTDRATRLATRLTVLLRAIKARAVIF